MPQNKTRKNEHGQVLLAVVVAVTVALAVGVSISTRTSNMSSRVSRTDTSSRIIAAAEGGAERFLIFSTEILDAFSQDSADVEDLCADVALAYDSEKNGCVIDYPPVGGVDQIGTKAVVSVERFNHNAPPNVDNPTHYKFSVGLNDLKEVVLYEESGAGTNHYSGTGLRLCWNNGDAVPYYVAYSADGEYIRGGFYSSAFTQPLNLSGFERITSGHAGYTYCGDIDLTEAGAGLNWFGLRIKSLYIGAEYAVFPLGGANLPFQGFKIVSIGMLQEEAQERTVRKISVYRSLPYLPDVFDYALYSDSPLN